jgi:hypothetical protein
LIAAGLLLLAGQVDLDELDHWVRVGGSVDAALIFGTARPTAGESIR